MLKINKWALLKETACNKMKSTTYPYHVVLVPKTKHKKKGNESGINYPGELKTSNSSRGHKISTRNCSDLTYRFLKLGSLFARCVRFEKLNKSDLPPFNHPRERASTRSIFPLVVPSLAASTFTFGALLWRYRKFKFKF
jgi:hypothetical protein